MKELQKSNINYCSLEIIEMTALESLVNSEMICDRFDICAAAALHL